MKTKSKLRTLVIDEKELKVIKLRLNAQNSFFNNYYTKDSEGNVIKISPDETRVSDDLWEKVVGLK